MLGLHRTASVRLNPIDWWFFFLGGGANPNFFPFILLLVVIPLNTEFQLARLPGSRKAGFRLNPILGGGIGLDRIVEMFGEVWMRLNMSEWVSDWLSEWVTPMKTIDAYTSKNRMEGACQYGDKKCWFKHSIGKYDTN